MKELNLDMSQDKDYIKIEDIDLEKHVVYFDNIVGERFFLSEPGCDQWVWKSQCRIYKDSCVTSIRQALGIINDNSIIKIVGLDNLKSLNLKSPRDPDTITPEEIDLSKHLACFYDPNFKSWYFLNATEFNNYVFKPNYNSEGTIVCSTARELFHDIDYKIHVYLMPFKIRDWVGVDCCGVALKENTCE